MLLQTVTQTIETHLEPEVLISLLVDAKNIPDWAPLFADTVEYIGESRYRLMKDGTTFEIRALVNRTAGTVDYLREMSGGKSGGAYIRVAPLPSNGSVIVMTVPVAPGKAAADVANILSEELARLVKLAEA